MPKAAASRPTLPTSSSDFALPPSSSSSSVASSPSHSTDDHNPFIPSRFRRSSVIAPKSGYFAERLHSMSPLAAAATIYSSRRRGASQSALAGDGSESDRDRMWTDSSPSNSSQNPTPPEYSEDNDKEPRTAVMLTQSPHRRSSSGSLEREIFDLPIRTITRRLSFPLRTPRVRTILAESRTRVEDAEAKAEAAFQRLISSGSELPMQPRIPRTASDRGRYPEEASREEEVQREDNSSDEEGAVDEQPFSFQPGGTLPINIAKACTPANSFNGDELGMSISESPGASSNTMDVDMPYGSPSFTSALGPINWRYTPPPTGNAMRSNKRKFDDRFDPYPTSTKRRAVSPSISHLSRTNGLGRLSLPLPITIPNSAASSAASSPTIACSYASGLSMSRPVSSSMGLSSPILRQMPRTGSRRAEGEEREIEGAGEAVGGLSLA